MKTATCPKCKAVYEIEEKRSPMRDSDYFDCVDCGERMDTWNSTTYPIYRKVRSGNKKDA